ncbi:MAG: ATP-binding protein [Bacteroidales bacterium]|nr:ATP-binding protein [Bacteroidales bacterium]MCF8458198.1 ATP-binding protein [Bacteroidales bacterium]
MQEITILSGKGGTGKTSITAALASLAENAVFCDNDVDAADLHLILQPKILEEHEFDSGWVAQIDKDDCIDCNICVEHCRFDAIKRGSVGRLEVNPFSCEGCRLCERVCPAVAITSFQNMDNSWYVSETRFGKMTHARMGSGQENSGKLVTTVRNKAKAIAKQSQADFVINDGPPGIGCPVISSVTGTGKVLLVIEPSVSGLHDAKRLIELVKGFNIPQFAIINKFDINREVSSKIEAFLDNENIPLLGKIPFDTDMVLAMIEKKSILEYATDSETSKRIKTVWEQLKQLEKEPKINIESIA